MFVGTPVPIGHIFLSIRKFQFSIYCVHALLNCPFPNVPVCVSLCVCICACACVCVYVCADMQHTRYEWNVVICMCVVS